MDTFLTLWHRHRFALVAGLITLACLGSVLVQQWRSGLQVKGVSVTQSPAPAAITVDIEGAVAVPGVRELAAGSLVEDAITAAGGLTEQADRERIARELNRSEPLKGHQKIYIPVMGEQAAGDTAESGEKINLNQADTKELESLPGIGPVTAKKIIEYREEHGGFQSVDQLAEIPGLSEKKVDALRDLVVV